MQETLNLRIYFFRHFAGYEGFSIQQPGPTAEVKNCMRDDGYYLEIHVIVEYLSFLPYSRMRRLATKSIEPGAD